MLKMDSEMSITALCPPSTSWMWIIAACLLAALTLPICMAAQDASSQKLYAPQVGSTSGAIQSDCLGRPGLLLRRPGLPPAIMNRLCKPGLGGTQTPQLANELDKNFDSAAGTFITFDVPGASNTFPVSINPAGEILGSTTDSSGTTTGFLRSSQGTFTTFNVSGATEYTYPFWGEGSSGSTLNPSGEVTGGYGDANFTLHGFVRDPSGAITTFDAPDADITPGDYLG